MVCLAFGSCRSRYPATVAPDNVHIIAEGIPDERGIELHFTVDNESGWVCPGVNVTPKANGRIDIQFIHVRREHIKSSECDILAERSQSNPQALKVKIPHDWSVQPEVEIFIDGLKSIGKWTIRQKSKRSGGTQRQHEL